MSIRQRAPTTFIVIAVLFLCIQFLPSFGFFLFVQTVILAALLEFYNLSLRRELLRQRVFGVVVAFLIGASFFFKEISLALAIFLSFFLAGVYFLLEVNTAEKIKHFTSSITITFFGAFYLGFSLSFFYWIREEHGRFYVYFLLLVVILGDSGAYFVGKLFGRHKQVPVASPNKTWEGSFGGFVFAAAGALIAHYLLLPELPVWKAAVSGILVHAVAQISDPLESLFKRAAGVKDSSNLLPGHGGFLDRIDSQVLAAPFFYFLLRVFWK